MTIHKLPIPPATPIEAERTAPREIPSVIETVTRPRIAPAIGIPSLISGYELGPEALGAPKSARISIKLSGMVSIVLITKDLSHTFEQ